MKSNTSNQTKAATETSGLLKQAGTSLRRVLGTLGMLALGLLAGAAQKADAATPVVDVGAGSLSSDAQFASADDANLRTSVNSGKKQTKFENLSATPIQVRKGQMVTLRAQLFYLDKNRKWQYLGYKSATNIQLWINGRPVSSGATERNGYVTFQIVATTTRKIPASGMRVNWHVVSPGDAELQGCRAMSSFTMLN